MPAGVRVVFRRYARGSSPSMNLDALAGRELSRTIAKILAAAAAAAPLSRYLAGTNDAHVCTEAL
jgi:hypothetical protein